VLQSMRVVYQDCEPVDFEMPYVSGFLGFREVPPFKALLARVPDPKPQVLLVDGLGVLHQRRCGSASQLGVETGYPTIGVGKTMPCVDGLHEYFVVQELRAALAQERGELQLDQLTCHIPGSDLPSPACMDINPATNEVMLPALSLGSSSTISPAVVAAPPRRFLWQAVSEDGPAQAQGPSLAVGVSEEFCSGPMTSGNIAADSGPVFEPTQGGNGPMGRMLDSRNQSSGSESTLQFGCKKVSWTADIMPVGEETDTDDTGSLARRVDTGLINSTAQYYCRPGRDGVSVVCVDLTSNVDGAKLGAAAAGLGGTVKPIYVSVGVPPAYCWLACMRAWVCAISNTIQAL
jgi:hypothetical protein